MLARHSLIGLVTLLTACTEVSYIKRDNARTINTDNDTGFTRQVNYHVAPAFYETPPACIMIIPSRLKSAPRPVIQTIDDTLGRHLSSRVDRVIDARRTSGEARERVYDLANVNDRQRLASALNCDTYAEVDTAKIDTLYALIWTDLSLNVGLTLRRAVDDKAIWQSYHHARRNGGGLPLTVFGAGTSTFAAGRLASDSDAVPSIVDDCIRRMVASLPDTRKF